MSAHAHGHEHGPAHGHSHGLVDDSIKRSREGLRAVGLALLVLGLTAAAQATVFIASGSVALLADLIHNVGDAATAIPLGIASALRSARGERLAGLAIVAAIFVSACVAASEAISRLIDPQPIDHLSAVALAGALGFAGTGSPGSSAPAPDDDSTALRCSPTRPRPRPGRGSRDDRLVPRDVGRPVVAPVEERVDHDRAGHRGCAVHRIGRAVGTFVGSEVEGPAPLPSPGLARHGLGVGVDQQLGRVGPEALLRLPRAVHPEPGTSSLFTGTYPWWMKAVIPSQSAMAVPPA